MELEINDVINALMDQIKQLQYDNTVLRLQLKKWEESGLRIVGTSENPGLEDEHGDSQGADRQADAQSGS